MLYALCFMLYASANSSSMKVSAFLSFLAVNIYFQLNQTILACNTIVRKELVVYPNPIVEMDLFRPKLFYLIRIDRNTEFGLA